MRGDRDPGSSLEQGVEAGDEGAPDDLGVPEGDRRRLDVDALAEPHARREVAQVGDVGERALEIGLQDDPHVLEPVAAEGA